MTRECHVRFCERLRGRFRRPTYHFGMKAHVGVDASSGLVHTAGVTSGNVHDAKVMDCLIRDDDTAVYGDKGYASDAKKRAAEAAGVLWAVKEKAKPGGRLTARQRARNHRFGKVRAKVEHVFRVVKCQFGYRKVRYRGIAKRGPGILAVGARKPVSRPQDICVRLTIPGPSAPDRRYETAALTRKTFA